MRSAAAKIPPPRPEESECDPYVSEAVRSGQGTPLPPKWAYLVNVIMDGIFRSAEAGYEVKVEADYGARVPAGAR